MAVASYDDQSGDAGGPPPPGGLWAAFDFETTDAVVVPPEDPPDPVDPNDPFNPPTRTFTVNNAPAGTTVQANTFYNNPQGSLTFPANIEHVTVVGAKTLPTIIRGWRDVHIQGTSSSYMDSGPRSDGGDLCQLKREVGGQVPEDITIRYWHGHDVTRPAGKHSDGIQLMCGRRITLVDCSMYKVAVQPFFVRDAGASAGGGPVEDITFLRCTSDADGAEGFYAFRVAGDDEVGKAGRYVPQRVKIVDCSGDKGVSMDAAAVSAGGEVINYTSL